MDFELSEEHRMLKELVARFVKDELMPLEAGVLAREADGKGLGIGAAEHERLDEVSRKLGLWGLDAPTDVGGVDLPHMAMVGVEEEMGRTVTPYTLPPDSPNLRMLMATVNERQREAYLAPYVRGETVSAIGISEPGAGADPSAMTTRAVRDGEDWVINGRKIWTSRAADADFTILMAVTDKEKGARGGISAFLVDKGTPGFNVLRRIPMIAGAFTYEVALEDCRVEGWKLLGTEGSGFAPMQIRLGTRRLQMAAWSVGMAQRHDLRVRPPARHLRRAPGRAPGDPVVGGRRGHPHPRGTADDLRLRLETRSGPRHPGRDLDDQGLRHRDGLGGRRSRHADVRGHGHDQGASSSTYGREAANDADL
jgi:acyl-CoA dehydrogenase